MKRLLVLRITGKAHQVFMYLRSIAKAYGHLTLKELMTRKE